MPLTRESMLFSDQQHCLYSTMTPIRSTILQGQKYFLGVSEICRNGESPLSPGLAIHHYQYQDQTEWSLHEEIKVQFLAVQPNTRSYTLLLVYTNRNYNIQISLLPSQIHCRVLKATNAKVKFLLDSIPLNYLAANWIISIMVSVKGETEISYMFKQLDLQRTESGAATPWLPPQTVAQPFITLSGLESRKRPTMYGCPYLWRLYLRILLVIRQFLR